MPDIKASARLTRRDVVDTLTGPDRDSAKSKLDDAVDQVLAVGGYLKPEQIGRVSDDERRAALSRFQDFHGLRRTGLLDDDTSKLLATSRCALPDTPPAAPASSIEASAICSWTTPVVRYAFGAGTDRFAGNSEQEIARRALRTWSRSGAPTFVEVDQDDPDLQMLFSWTPADCEDHDMTGSVLAHADYPPSCPFFDAALPQPIHMDDEEHEWIDGGTGGTDVETVVLHEAGHIVGLGHSGVSDAVMKSSIAPDIEKRVLHADDLTGVGSLYRGRSHLHLLESDGTVGPRSQTNIWTAGWSTVETFTVDGDPFVMLLKHGTGDIHIHRINGSATIGERVYDRRWTSWWSTAEFYEIGGTTYLFLLKERGKGNDGNNIHIHQMNTDGSVGPRVINYNWTEGWSTAEFYEIGGTTYLFLLKERGKGNDGNNIHIHQMNTDGSVGPRVINYNWTEGWSTAEFYEIGGTTYLFLLKERGKGNDGNNIHIHQMNTDGSVGPRVINYNWTEGWTTAEFYGSGGGLRLFLMKVAGTGNDGNNVHVHAMDPNGAVGPSMQTANWTEGWTSMQPFTSTPSEGFMLVKSCDVRP